MLIQILTVVLGVILVLSLLSLLATAVMEWLEGVLRLKSKNLLTGLHGALASTDVNERVYRDFISHPRFRQLAPRPERKRSFPSRLPPEDFQAILFDLLTRYYGQPILTPQDLSQSIALLPDVDLKNTLTSIYSEVNGDPQNFRFKLQAWYQGLADIAAERYARQTRRFLFALGLLIAIAFNADTLQIFQALQSDPAKTQRVLGLVSQYGGGGDGPAPPPAEPEVQPFTPPNAPTEVQPFTPPNAPPPQPQKSAQTPEPFQPPAAPPNPSPEGGALKKDLVNRLIDRELNNAQSPLGIGWNRLDLGAMTGRSWTFKVSGWVLTALAISFGAGFWFDLLRKLVKKRPGVR